MSRYLRRPVVGALAASVASVLALGAWASPAAPADSRTSAPPPSIVGRWQQLHTCQQLVDALTAEGLEALAPVMVGDYFPDQTLDQLLEKDDLCSGAKPQVHSHFFTAGGSFGSVDQFGNQVDEDRYTVVDPDTLQIGDGTFDFSIQSVGLQLAPVITDKQRREALRHPEQWSTAGWMVAVAYPGSTWEKVACLRWC